MTRSRSTIWPVWTCGKTTIAFGDPPNHAAVVNLYSREYYRAARHTLRPGGVLLMHVPVAGAHGSTGHLGDVLRRTPKQWVKAAALPLTRALMRAGMERLPWKIDFYRWYDYPWLCATLERIGFTEVEIRLLPWSGGHSYVLARRAAMGTTQAIA